MDPMGYSLIYKTSVKSGNIFMTRFEDLPWDLPHMMFSVPFRCLFFEMRLLDLF